MAYQVALTDSAKADTDSIYRWVMSQAPGRGPEWFEGLLEALYSLEQLPLRCPWLVRPRRPSEIFAASYLAGAVESIGFFTKWRRGARWFGSSTSATAHSATLGP